MSRVTHIQRIVLATMVAALIGGATPAAEPESAAARAFRKVAEQAAAQVSIASFSKVIPLTPVR